jgi:hypothetical protein
VAERNRTERAHEARAAEPLVERAVLRARTALLERDADLGSVRRLHAEIAEQELGAILGRRLAHLCETDRAALSEAVRRLAARHAHLHLSSLKDRIAGGVA